MAESPAHRFGQIVGEVLEQAIEPLLRDFAQRHELYLDKRGPRRARTGSKVTWIDKYGNPHDLDFVLEKGGTQDRIGIPVAFIEPAYRRYTKHSRNKAQEIQGAVLLLAETHRNVAPFLGAVLAGVFTDGAMAQLKSLGFKVLYIPNIRIIDAFRKVGIDAQFEEETPDRDLAAKVQAWEALPPGSKQEVSKAVVEMSVEQVETFMNALERSVNRRVELIRVLPLHGSPVEVASIDDAIKFIEQYAGKDAGRGPLARYEVQVRFNNGDRIEGQFIDQESAIEFLRSFRPPPIRPA